MKVNANLLFGAIIGSVITFLAVFFLRPTFLTAEHISQESIKQLSPSSAIEEPFQSEPIDVNEIKECNQDCINKVVKNMIEGKDLHNEYGAAINNLQARKTAQYLIGQPKKVAKIEKTLSTLGVQDARDSILVTFSLLPEKQLKAIAQNLALSNSIRDRTDGIYLLFAATSQDINVDNELKNIIQNDDDHSVALNAIAALYNISETGADSVSKDRLRKIIISDAKDELRSEALVAKTRVFEVNNETKADIKTALNSKSEPLKQAGIQACDDILSRQSSGTASGNWVTDSTLKQMIENIANNTKAEPFTRVEALNLLRRHYY